ncbi:MAG TPA: N-acetylmuramoyl-L-alanine amidase [Candidatus Binatia bacterium]
MRLRPWQAMTLLALAASAQSFATLPAYAAVVQQVRAATSTSATRIVVDVDGPFRYRSRASDDGSSILIDIPDAVVTSQVPRLLPVSDRRVDGVLVLHDEDARIVRLSVDVAGRVAPHLHARIDGNRLLIDLVDASSDDGPAAHTSASVSGGDPAEPDARTKRLARERAERLAAGSDATPEKETRDVRASRAGNYVRATRAGDDVRASGAEARRRGPVASSRAHATRSLLEKKIVVLDPGHGGKDPGASAWTGEYEKDIVLDVAERVARRLKSRGDIEVVMTRTSDEFVSLADRRDASRRAGADAFISIHANASRSAAARGFETYYHTRQASPQPDAVVRRLARAENGREGRRGGDNDAAAITRASAGAASPVLDHHAESARLAGLVQGQLVSQLGMRYEAVRDLGAREGPFFVIDYNAAPSVLVEAAFLTHREEGVRMQSEVYREQIAEGIARGIVLFLDQQHLPGTL